MATSEIPPVGGLPLPLSPSTPRLSVKDFARYVYAKSERRKRSILRRQKFRTSDGFAPMTYYVRATGIIRRFLRSNRDRTVVDADLKKLEALLLEKKGAAFVKIERNIKAVRQFLRLYGDRRFALLSVPRGWKLNSQGVSISASPDLHVEENGVELLIKFDFCRTPEDESYIPLMLQIIRDASRKAGLRVRATNIIVFDVAARREHSCPRSRAPLKSKVTTACHEIARGWDKLE